MTQIIRSKNRVKQTGEVFTPLSLVDEILEKFPDDVWMPSKTFLDPACGDGNFLVRVVAWRIWLGSTPEEALKSTYGVDIMQDNVNHTRFRLLTNAFYAYHHNKDKLLKHLTYNDEQNITKMDGYKGFVQKYKHIVYKNIVCHDALTYDYNFDHVYEELDEEVIEPITETVESIQPSKPTIEPPIKKPIKIAVISEQEELEDKIDKLQIQMDLVKNDYRKWSTLKTKQDKLKAQR